MVDGSGSRHASTEADAHIGLAPGGDCMVRMLGGTDYLHAKQAGIRSRARTLDQNALASQLAEEGTTAKQPRQQALSSECWHRDSGQVNAGGRRIPWKRCVQNVDSTHCGQTH